MYAQAPLLPTPPSWPHGALFSSLDSVHCSAVQGLLPDHRKERNPTPPRRAIYNPWAGRVVTSEKHSTALPSPPPFPLPPSVQGSVVAHARVTLQTAGIARPPPCCKGRSLPLGLFPRSPAGGHPHTPVSTHPTLSERIHLTNVWTCPPTKGSRLLPAPRRWRHRERPLGSLYKAEAT